MAELSRGPNPLEVERCVPIEAVAERLFRFRCVGCGYGASCKVTPARCPMCGGKTWEYEDQQSLADLDGPLGAEPNSLDDVLHDQSRIF